MPSKHQDETTASRLIWTATLASGHTTALHVGSEEAPNDEHFVLSLAGPLGTLLIAKLEKGVAESLSNILQNQLEVWDFGLRLGQRVRVRVWSSGDMESYLGQVTALDASTRRARVQIINSRESWFPFERVTPLEEEETP